MTEDQTHANIALEKCDGDRHTAAAILGIEVKQLNGIVRRCPELKSRWNNRAQQRETPLAVETLHRPPTELQTPLSDEEQKLLTSTLKEDELVQDGLLKLNLTEKEAAIAIELQQFHQKHFIKSINIMGASVTRMSLKLQTQLDELDKRLQTVREKLALEPVPYHNEKGFWFDPRAALVEEERSLLGVYVPMTDQIRKMFEVFQRGMILQAMVRMRMRQLNGAPIQEKPGYRPPPKQQENTDGPNGIPENSQAAGSGS